MKKIQFLLAALLLSLALAGQAMAQNTVESIRERYASVKKQIELMSEEYGWPPRYYQVNILQNLPATGMHKEDVKMYYEEIETEEDVIYPPYRLEFATASYNYSVRNFYEEYLYDEDGKPAFIYARNPDIVFGLDYDFRMYFSKGKMIKCTIKCRPSSDGEMKFIEEIWDPSAPKDEEGWQNVYSGKDIPEKYMNEKENYLRHAEKYLELFKSVDGVAYH